MATSLKIATLSYAVALIPSEPLYSHIAAASKDITARFENRNIIDNVHFPAHVSLFLAGTDRDLVEPLWSTLDDCTHAFLKDSYEAIQVHCGAGGFISVNCAESASFRSLLDAVIAVCGEHHRCAPRYRPHLIERWPQLSTDQREALRTYGTYKVGDAFHPHLSVAYVSKQNVNEAFALAETSIRLPLSFQIQAIQLVDVGHMNEKWDVLDECRSNTISDSPHARRV